MPGRYHEVIKRAFDLVQKAANDKAYYGPIEHMSEAQLMNKIEEENLEYRTALGWESPPEAAAEGAHLIWSIIMHMYCNGLLPEPMPHYPPPDEYIKLPEDKPTYKWEGSPCFGRAQRGDIRASGDRGDPGPHTSDFNAPGGPLGPSEENLA